MSTDQKHQTASLKPPGSIKLLAPTRRLWLLAISLAIAGGAVADEGPKRPVEGIMDNSFLIEEAYNQEPGVVQHIFNALYGMDKISDAHNHSLALSFTQEWPVFNQTHQFSYTVPYGAIWAQGGSANGIGDVLLNYRYQVFYDEKTLTGFAPRFSLVLPTGDKANGFGNGTLGYQWSLPFSTTLSDRWFVHANAGLTYLPGAGTSHDGDLLNYNLGASAIYCVSGRFNLMLEWIGLWNESGVDTGRTRRDFSAVISPGARWAFNFHNGSQSVVGVGVPIGLTKAAPEIGTFLYVSFEHKLF